LTEQHNNVTRTLPAIVSNQNNKRNATVEWLKASDGAKLGCRIWLGEESAPVILYLHGIEGHGQWFENTACALAERGITVYAPDRRGSGMNGTLRGHLENYNTLLSDLESQIRHIRRQHRSQRLILVANCWSTKLASVFAQSNYETTDKTIIPPLAGLVLIAPAIYTKVDFPLLTKLQIALQFLLGGRSLLKYWPVPLTTNRLTNNKKFLEFLENDPLRLTKATTSFFAQTFFLTKKAQQAAKNIKTPLLILQGEDDLIVDTEKLETWYQQVSSKDKAIHAFPGADHSLDFDANWFSEYVHVLSDWIINRGQFGT
jgi:alpha-beta hydrolase superfamily lysophospholipase